MTTLRNPSRGRRQPAATRTVKKSTSVKQTGGTASKPGVKKIVGKRAGRSASGASSKKVVTVKRTASSTSKTTARKPEQGKRAVMPAAKAVKKVAAKKTFSAKRAAARKAPPSATARAKKLASANRASTLKGRSRQRNSLKKVTAAKGAAKRADLNSLRTDSPLTQKDSRVPIAIVLAQEVNRMRKLAQGALGSAGSPSTASTTRISLVTPRLGPVAVKALPVSMSPDLERKVLENAQLFDALCRLSEQVTFQVSPKTLGGIVLKHTRGRWNEYPLEQLRMNPDAVEIAITALERLGISIVRRGRFGITCRGPIELVSSIIQSPFHVMVNQRPSSVRSIRSYSEMAMAPSPGELSIVPQHSLSMETQVSPAIDSFAFYPAPLYFHAPPGLSKVAPVPAWHHLDGAALRQHLKVPTAAGEPTGRGVTVAMIDSGFYPHPYFSAYDYQTRDVPGNAPSSIDTDGHGTAMAWNVFQVAPQVTLLGVSHSGVPDDAFEIADEADAQIISCSWGWDYEKLVGNLELTIRELIKEGRTIICASGNGHYAWPGSLPEVLSVGGVYVDTAGQPEASNYASGFVSSRYPGRQVPDVCGLVGQLPRAIYLMMPCPPGAAMDKDNAGTKHPQFDETKPDDGWVGASGTSAATPQVAGVAALLIERAAQLGRTLDPATIKQILTSSATNVSKGFNAQGIPATTNKPNGAVGHGLVDVTAALSLV